MPVYNLITTCCPFFFFFLSTASSVLFTVVPRVVHLFFPLRPVVACGVFLSSPQKTLPPIITTNIYINNR